MYTILRTVDAGTETATATATCKLQAPSCQDPTIDSSGLVISWPRGRASLRRAPRHDGACLNG